MKTVARDDFLKWVAEAGIGVDPKYAKNWPWNLSYEPCRIESRYWVTPSDLRGLEYFLRTAVSLLGEFKTLYLWPKSGGWLSELAEESALCRVALRVSGEAGDGAHALGFAQSEIDDALLLLTCSAGLGWSWVSDLYVITDQRDVVLMVDHHHCLWADFATQERCNRFVKTMTENDFLLPEAPPDSTFKPVSRMVRRTP